MISRVTNQRPDKTAFRLTVPVVHIIAWMDGILLWGYFASTVCGKQVGIFSILLGMPNHAQLHFGHIYCCLVNIHGWNSVNAIGICTINSFVWRQKKFPINENSVTIYWNFRSKAVFFLLLFFLFKIMIFNGVQNHIVHYWLSLYGQ